MTILEYITPSRMGGAEEYFLRLIVNLSRQGHRVVVVTKRDCQLREAVQTLTHNENIELHGWKTSGKFDPKTLLKLRRLIRTDRIDLVHTHLTTASWLGAMAGRLSGVPTVAHIHGADSKTWFQRADYLIAVAEGVKKHLVEQGIDGSRVPVLYYGIDLEKYAAPLPTPEAKARLGLAPDTKTVGIIGSLIPRKGHRHLLNALKKIEPSVGEVHAIFAGEGAEEAALRQQTQALGLEGRVHFLGFRTDAADIMAACDGVALPSYKEGLSIAMMEAMALARPVLVTNVAGMPELVQHQKTGWMTSPGDEDELARALGQLFCEPETTHRMALTGRDFVVENFDQRACLARMERFLYSVSRAAKKSERVDCNQWTQELSS